MSEPIDTIVSDAMHLPPDQRLTVAHRILTSVEPETSSEIEAAWDAEIRQPLPGMMPGKFKAFLPPRSSPKSIVQRPLLWRERRSGYHTVVTQALLPVFTAILGYIFAKGGKDGEG